jgi:hypothetical protein
MLDRGEPTGTKRPGGLRRCYKIVAEMYPEEAAELGGRGWALRVTYRSKRFSNRCV